MCDINTTYAVPFTAWDLRLFLDTHPDDACALEAYQKLCAQCGCAEKENRNYACLPTRYTDGGWHWINNPWPWEYEANCAEGRR